MKKLIILNKNGEPIIIAKKILGDIDFSQDEDNVSITLKVEEDSILFSADFLKKNEEWMFSQVEEG